jgi:hypothetical protein
MEPTPMGYYVAGAVFWILNIRGHIPQFGDYRPIRHEPSGDAGGPARIVIGFLVSVAFLALALWLAVWLAIRLL